MMEGRMGLWIKIIFVVGILFFFQSAAYSDSQQSGKGKAFLYTATKFGVPILKATIKIENESIEEGKSLFHVRAFINSLQYLRLIFRMNNRFTSTMEAETCSPVRYVKEIDQEGLLTERKNYLHTVTFDHGNRKMVLEKREKKERQEISLPPNTYDPLSMFARCYLKEDIHPGQEIRMSIYDGVKLRQIVFHSKKEKVKSKMYGEVEAICLESTTSFSAFGEKEGIIRIWYIKNGEKTPILIELDLPIGDVRFELDEVKEG